MCIIYLVGKGYNKLAVAAVFGVASNFDKKREKKDYLLPHWISRSF